MEVKYIEKVDFRYLNYKSFMNSVIGQELLRLTQEIEDLAVGAIVHQKKIQYAASQLRSFTSSYLVRNQMVTRSPTTHEMTALQRIIENVNQYRPLISQNMIHNWAHYAINGSSTALAAELCEIARRLNIEAAVLDKEDAHFFDPSDPRWLQYHIMDLHTVHSSFTSYLEKRKNYLSKETVISIQARLQSIDKFCKEYENEDILPKDMVFSPIPIHYKSWVLDPNDLEEGKQIGTGVSSNVYIGKIKSTKEVVAIKKLKHMKLSGSRFRSFQREITVLATVVHPTLLKFFGATETPPFCIVTEWMKGGSLFYELHRRKRLDQTQLLIVAYDIARGMNFLHNHQIIHRDLKSLNVLLDENGKAKICDFGFSKKYEKNEIMTKNIGTPHWMAPELLAYDKGYDTKIDVYSYGVVLWEILTKLTPYKGMDPKEIIKNVLENDLHPNLSGINIPDGLEELIKSCWERNPNERPKFSEILERFKAGEIYLPGADRDLFMKYVEETLEDDNKESLQIQEMLQSFKNSSGVSPDEFIYTITNSTIPQQLIDQAWEVMINLKSSDNSLLAQGYSVFLKTKKAPQAARALREFPENSVPERIIYRSLISIPTGNDSFDEDLLLIACNNNMKEEAVMRAYNPIHTQLALDILSKYQVRPLYKNAIIARCILCLTGDNDSLAVSAYRCLISMNEANKIAMSILYKNIQTHNTLLKTITHLAIKKMVDEGYVFPIEFIDKMISIGEDDPLVIQSVAYACDNIEIAKTLLERFKEGSYSFKYELIISILLKAQKHKSLIVLLNDVLKKFKSVASEDYLPLITDLENSINS